MAFSKKAGHVYASTKYKQCGSRKASNFDVNQQLLTENHVLTHTDPTLTRLHFSFCKVKQLQHHFMKLELKKGFELRWELRFRKA